MGQAHPDRALTLIGATVLALTIGVMVRHSIPAPNSTDGELRDAVASPAAPPTLPMLGGAHALRPNESYFAGPSKRRAEAERALLSSRLTKVSKSMRARAAQLRREAARERALAVSAQ